MASTDMALVGVVHAAAQEIARLGMSTAPLDRPQPMARTARGTKFHAPGCLSTGQSANVVTEHVALSTLAAEQLCQRCHGTLAAADSRPLRLAHKVLALADRTAQWEHALEVDPTLFSTAETNDLRARANRLAEQFAVVADDDPWREWKLFARSCADRLYAVAARLVAAADHAGRMQRQRAALDLMSHARSLPATRRIAPQADYACCVVGDQKLESAELLNYVWASFWQAAQEHPPAQAADITRADLDVDLKQWVLPSWAHVPPVPMEATANLRDAVDRTWREAARAELLKAIDAWSADLTRAASTGTVTVALTGMKNVPTLAEKRMLSLLTVRRARHVVLAHGDRNVIMWLAKFAEPNKPHKVTVTVLPGVDEELVGSVMDTAVATFTGTEKDFADLEQYTAHATDVWNASRAAVAA